MTCSIPEHTKSHLAVKDCRFCYTCHRHTPMCSTAPQTRGGVKQVTNQQHGRGYDAVKQVTNLQHAPYVNKQCTKRKQTHGMGCSSVACRTAPMVMVLHSRGAELQPMPLFVFFCTLFVDVGFVEHNLVMVGRTLFYRL